jgi:hypothetical protein
VRCIGAPIWNWDRLVVAAVSMAGTITRINEDTCDALASQVRQAALAISRQLGSLMPAASCEGSAGPVRRRGRADAAAADQDPSRVWKVKERFRIMKPLLTVAPRSQQTSSRLVEYSRTHTNDRFR